MRSAIRIFLSDTRILELERHSFRYSYQPTDVAATQPYGLPVNPSASGSTPWAWLVGNPEPGTAEKRPSGGRQIVAYGKHRKSNHTPRHGTKHICGAALPVVAFSVPAQALLFVCLCLAVFLRYSYQCPKAATIRQAKALKRRIQSCRSL